MARTRRRSRIVSIQVPEPVRNQLGQLAERMGDEKGHRVYLYEALESAVQEALGRRQPARGKRGK